MGRSSGRAKSSRDRGVFLVAARMRLTAGLRDGNLAVRERSLASGICSESQDGLEQSDDSLPAMEEPCDSRLLLVQVALGLSYLHFRFGN